jgi:hypothetical protein
MPVRYPCGRVQRQTIADLDEIAAGNDQQPIAAQLRRVECVQLQGIRGRILQVGAIEHGFEVENWKT